MLAISDHLRSLHSAVYSYKLRSLCIMEYTQYWFRESVILESLKSQLGIVEVLVHCAGCVLSYQ